MVYIYIYIYIYIYMEHLFISSLRVNMSSNVSIWRQAASSLTALAVSFCARHDISVTSVQPTNTAPVPPNVGLDPK